MAAGVLSGKRPTLFFYMTSIEPCTEEWNKDMTYSLVDWAAPSQTVHMCDLAYCSTNLTVVFVVCAWEEEIKYMREREFFEGHARVYQKAPVSMSADWSHR